jgi:aldehyde dehydrogenase (NAD+)
MTVTTEPRQDARAFIDARCLSVLDGLRASGSIRTADPFTGELIADVPTATHEAVEDAVARARNALQAWRRRPASERAALLRQLADLIDAQYDTMAAVESLDAGKLFAGTRGWDVANARDVLRFYADDGPAYLERASVYERATERRQAIGVAALLAPWNAPLAVGVWKLAPALLAGCTIVMKAPERAPMSTLALASLAREAGFPEGVVNVLTGDGAVGEALVSHPSVGAISFTGGSDIASAIVGQSAENMPRLLLELGGKNSNVVFGDADLDDAVAGTLTAMFDVAGQNCCAGSRTLVERGLYDEFVERVIAEVTAMQVGDQFDPLTNMGPQIDGRHAAEVMAAVDHAKADGATVLVGGVVGGPNGTCVAPTVVAPRSFDQAIWTDEIFGPVGCIAPFDNLAEALSLANDTRYGLSASVWSRSAETCEQFARDIEVGVCWTNTYSLFDIGVPWGGIKRSGYGRELALQTLDEYTQAKVVY